MAGKNRAAKKAKRWHDAKVTHERKRPDAPERRRQATGIPLPVHLPAPTPGTKA